MSHRIKASDRVTVAGIPGVHHVTGIEPATPATQHTFCDVLLGARYGRKLPGESIKVEAWRCSIVPVDLEDMPA